MSHSFLSASGVGYTRERRKHLPELPKSLDDVNLSDYTTGKGESFVLADAILSRRIPRAVQSYGDFSTKFRRNVVVDEIFFR